MVPPAADYRHLHQCYDAFFRGEINVKCKHTFHKIHFTHANQIFIILNYLYNMKEIAAHISIDPEIRFGKPCIKGTRITVADILQWLASGMTQEEVLNDYPSLNKDDILAALAFAANRESIIKIIAA
jgi:uncharacterized protein (DUF433 family)